MLKLFRIINFRGFHYPKKFFNNKIFPDYGILLPCLNMCTDSGSYIRSLLPIQSLPWLAKSSLLYQIMFNVFSDSSCSKLCWHNTLGPTHGLWHSQVEIFGWHTVTVYYFNRMFDCFIRVYKLFYSSHRACQIFRNAVYTNKLAKHMPVQPCPWLSHCPWPLAPFHQL